MNHEVFDDTPVPCMYECVPLKPSESTDFQMTVIMLLMVIIMMIIVIIMAIMLITMMKIMLILS